MFNSDNEIGESLDPTAKPKSNVKLFVIIGVSVVVVVAIVVTVVLLTKGDDDEQKNGEIKTSLSNIPLPEDIQIDDGHYMFDGNIFICYKRSTTNFTYFGVISDEGKNFKELYGEEFIVTDKANGIRLIPFRDNKHIYLGDFVFECNDTTKTISECEKGVLIRVNYPDIVVKNPNTYKTWSEMVVAPDMVHVAWTSLNAACGAVNFLGKFQRTENSYEIVDCKIISTITFVEKDQSDESKLITKKIRGGEIKQFIEGGNALTLVGTQPDEFVKSVYQSLKEDKIYTYSHEAGYDETSILSPDEKLGITMSTRFSPKTNMAIFGLMPRPHCSLVLSKIVESVYTYAVTNVRKYRNGNVGPVLFNKEKSINDPNYHGIDLHDTEEKFVFCSPISWHPSNMKAIWPEVERGTTNRRLRKLEIRNYTPSAYPKIENTTDDVPYALDMSEMNNIRFESETNGTIIGKHSGKIVYYNSGFFPTWQTVKITYVNYSDDGKKFYNGEEEFIGNRTSKNVYKSNVILSGSESGTNNFTITFTNTSDLIKEETEGYSSYGGKTIRAEDYIE